MAYRTCSPNPGSLLFYLRTSRGLTQARLSQLCRVGINTICQYELRSAPMTLANLRSLANFFDVPLDALARDDLSFVVSLPPVFHTRSNALRERIHDNLQRMEEIGDAGEDFVANMERKKLRGTRYQDKVNTGLADDKKAACDMMSFDPVTGAPVLIEVKSTSGDEDEDLYISREELELLRHCAASGIPYELHRVYHVGTNRVAQTVYTAQEVLDAYIFAPTAYVARRKGVV